MEAQHRFDFESDNSPAERCCLGEGWSQVPASRWCCDSLEPIAGASSLKHGFDNSQEGCDYLVFRHDPLNIRDSFAYSFRIRHGFLPSAMNNWQLVLGAGFEEGSVQDGTEPQITRGLVLGVNFTGSDDLIKIWHVDQGQARVLCTTTLNYQEQAGSDRAPLFKVLGDGNDNLDLYWSPDPAEQPPELLASCRMEGISWGRHLLLRYRYTSSRDRALWLDELEMLGSFEQDTTAPHVRDVRFLDARTLRLDFSEDVIFSDAFTVVLYSNEFPGGLAPEEILFLGDRCTISFLEMLPNRVDCRLGIQGVADGDGNLMDDTILHVMRNDSEWGDVVFNEIMADPEPAVRQVEEYLELYNRSDYPLNLEGWHLKVNDRNYLLNASMATNWSLGGATSEPEETELPAHSFLLLTGLTLPNEGALLALYNREGTLVHAASYRLPWDGPGWKKEGGWSLESPDADQPCRISYNWEYSTDPGGGTPGRANSNQAVLQDRIAPVLLYAGLGDSGELLLHFSEALGNFQDQGEAVVPDPAGIHLNPGDLSPDSVRLLDPLREILYLHFPEDFRAWQQYRIDLPGFGDCQGNRSGREVLQAGILSHPVPRSVVINEIMYDPEDGKAEYVELFVPGPDILDLQDLAIHLVEEGGMPDHPLPLSSNSRLVLPGQYLVLTDCLPQLEETYRLEVSGRWVEVTGLSGLNKSSGCIFLTDRAGRIVDRAVYSDALHMTLLEDPKGISLERISADRPGDDPGNWHSASSTSGYATPGFINSQCMAAGEAAVLLEVSPEVFSPDNDGFEDLLEITVNTGGHDWVIALVITDLQGNRIRTLANNHLAGPSSSYGWDGERQDGTVLPMGFYVIHARAYHPSTGEQWVRRKAVGLVYR